VISEAVTWLIDDVASLPNSSSHPAIDVPNAQEIVVAAACQLVSIRAPFQSAHFLSMILIGADQALRDGGCSDIISVNL
jgi:hypothetical protein